MLKRSFLTILIGSVILWADLVAATVCSDQSVRIEKAEDVSSLASRSCSTLTGSLIITGLSTEISLAALSGIVEISGGLYIYILLALKPLLLL